MTALLGLITLGRITYNYDREGQAIPVGEPLMREFAAREYEWYAQDTWRVRPNLTVTLGLRHSIYSPPYEKNGVQVAPIISLGEWFETRGSNAR
jgi:outer membrane receptor protein involved in Fe transport